MSSFVCGFCAHGNPEGSKFCNECGSPLHLAPCPRCEAINNAGEAQCVQCGAPLSSPGIPLRASPAQAVEPAPDEVAPSTRENAVPAAFAQRLDAVAWRDSEPSAEEFERRMAADRARATAQDPMRAMAEEPVLAMVQEPPRATAEDAAIAAEDVSVATIDDPSLAATLDGDPAGRDDSFGHDDSAGRDIMEDAPRAPADDHRADYGPRKPNRVPALILGVVVVIVAVALYETSVNMTHPGAPSASSDAAPKTAAEPATPPAAAPPSADNAPTQAPAANPESPAASAPASGVASPPTAEAPTPSTSEPPKVMEPSTTAKAKPRTTASAPRRAVTSGRTPEQAERDATATRRLITRELGQTPQSGSAATPSGQ
jgi:hypothetical protein